MLQRYQAYKHHWSGTRLPVVLEVGPCSLEQLDPSTHTLLASYPYCDIQGIIPVRDIPGGFVLAVGGYIRLHLFSNSMEHQAIIGKMLEMANLILNTTIKVLTETITLDDYHNQRFGKYRYEKLFTYTFLTFISEFCNLHFVLNQLFNQFLFEFESNISSNCRFLLFIECSCQYTVEPR